MAHTPGPWDIEMDRGEPRVIRQRADPDVAVALIPRWELKFLEEMNANAKLIAAAPDLLAALQGVVRVADRATDEFDAARAAIARATK